MRDERDRFYMRNNRRDPPPRGIRGPATEPPDDDIRPRSRNPDLPRSRDQPDDDNSEDRRPLEPKAREPDNRRYSDKR